jgi:hypothetical protein
VFLCVTPLSLLRAEAMSGAANASAIVDPTADFPNSTKEGNEFLS